MARPSSAVDRIMPVLMLFIEQGRHLPATAEGKVNVLQLCRDLKAMGGDVKEPDTQHFHKKEELKDVVNTYATEQGLLPIGHRAPSGDVEEMEQRLQQATKQARQDAQSAVEATAAQMALAEELKQVRAALEEKNLEVTALRERLRLIEEGGFLIPMTPTPKKVQRW